MKSQIVKYFTMVAAAIALLSAATAARAQSAYSNAVINLNPVAYWPLQETTPPPSAFIETNLGSIGPLGNVYYGSDTTNISMEFPGATADGDGSVEFAGNANAFAIVPTTDNRVSLVGAKAFTVEGWRYPTSINSYVTIVADTGPVGAAGNNAANSTCGWSLDESWTPFRGTGGGNNSFRGWSFHVFNGSAFTTYVGGAEAGAAINYNLNQWYYVAGVFDGTNCTVYVNGVNMTSYQIPMTGSFVADTWDPIEMGCERGLGANPTHGGLDEVAIYTNALSAAQIMAHYNAAGTPTGVGSYTNVILNDHPVMYWRMDAPVPTIPPTNSYPAALNCGSLAANMTNFNTFGTNAVYQPGAVPGLPGPAYSGFGPFTNACGFNGIVGAVDGGYNKALDPTGFTNNYTVIAWFRGNPMFDNGHWNTMVSHSDSSWKIVVQNGNTYVYKGSGGLPNPPVIPAGAYNVNDGNWHMAVFENTFTNGVSTNLTVMLDGGAITVNDATNFNGTPGKPTVDAFIGCAADNLEPLNGFSTYNSGQQTFNGRIAHVAFFTNALTAAQILNLYTNAGATPPPPVIISQPTSGRTAGSGGTGGVGPGSYIFFGVAASGIGTLGYQWYHSSSASYSGTNLVDDAVKYTNEATFNMTVSNLLNSDSGYYYVVITNSYGATTSALASLQITATPAITAQSPSGTFSAYAGQSPTLSVTANSAANGLTYQWYTNGVADTTAGTTASYTLTSVQTAMTGFTYQVVVANTLGSVTGALDTLTVNPYPAVLTNNAYSSNLLSFVPTAYWPMHEISPAVPGDTETNYGSLGALGTGYYGDWDVNAGAPGNSAIFHRMTGALAGDSDTCIGVTRGAGEYMLVPRVSPQLTLTPPFTIETWVKAFDVNAGLIMSMGGGLNLNGNANPSGFDLYWDNFANAFSFVTFSNGIGFETRTGSTYNPGTWYDVVATYTGSNVVFYINGNQVPLALSPNSPMTIDYSSPLSIGGGNWNGNINSLFAGSIDEVAIYTNLLSSARISQHYNAGLDPATYGAYATNILADNPLIYMRMDSPPYVAPAASAWPILTNYGSSAISGTYSPGVAPGSVAGPSAVFANAVPFNGMSGYADAGSSPAFNPVNRTSFSYTFWFQGNPADSRFQNLIGHSDSSWRCDLTANGQIQFHTVADVIDTTYAYNDGNWHNVVATYNGANSNAALYVDGMLDTNIVTGSTNPGTTLDAFLGSDPLYTNNPAGPGRQFAGSLCEVAFYNGQVLTPSQVQTLYTSADQAPYIKQQPVSAAVNQNTAYTNVVVAGGLQTLYYQWYTNGVAMGGATNSTLGFNPVATNNAGNYYVVVTNNYGSVTSAVANVIVYGAPGFASVLPVTYTNLMVLYGGTNISGQNYIGSTPTFSVSAFGAQPLSYQWTTNGVAVGGATGTSITFTNLQFGGPTNFACVVSNGVGMVTNTWLAYYQPAPTAPFPQAVLAAQPIAYWRLNEPDDQKFDGNPGAICDDYNSGNNGLYTNVDLSQQGYDPTTDPAETSAQFGLLANNCDASSIVAPDFSAPSGVSAEFTVEAWVYPNTTAEPGNAGIISKGYFNQEEFFLDYNGGFRFGVRVASGGAAITLSKLTTTAATINQWYHMVGVCDEANGLVSLYINGATNALSPTNSTIPALSGITNSSRAPITIGGRATASYTGVNNQFIGYINDVAVFNYAMSQSQVASQYASSGVSPFFVKAPPTTNALTANSTLTISSVALVGAPSMTYWWLVVRPDQSIVTNIVTGVTNGAFLNPSLTISNVPAVWSGDSLELAVSNAFGGTNSFTVLNVSSAPVITNDLPPSLTLLGGRYYTYNIGVIGTTPLAFQWYNGSTPIAGQTNSTYTILATTPSTNSYNVIITNIFGSATSAVSTAVVISSYQSMVLSAAPAAYWPLNEHPDDGAGDDGVIAHDIAGTNNAFYTNSIIGVAGLPGDPNTCAQFGNIGTTAPLANMAEELSATANPDMSPLAANNGGNGEFSIEAWVNGPAQALNARMVTEGHFNGEEWTLDCGVVTPSGAFRFVVRNTAANYYAANSTVIADGNWHHLVGVCDEANGSVQIYVDGVLNTNAAGPAPASGILEDPLPITIGNADSSSDGSGYFGPQFHGKMCNVAIYTNVLTPAQILTHYQAELAGQVATPTITNQLPIPGTNLFTLYAGVRPTFTVGVAGLPPLAYQWYSNGVAVASATNNAFTSGKVQIGSVTNYCIITNSIGSVTSMVWTASVAADPMALFPATVLSNNPVAYWRLNESAGSAIANDYAGGASGFYGTNTTVGAAGVPFGSLAGDLSVGMNNTAPNVAAGCVVNDGLLLNTNAATFLCWVYPSTSSENNPCGLIFCRTGTTVSGSQIGAVNNLDYTWNNVATTFNFGSGLVVPANVWSLVALTTTSSNAVLYVFNTNRIASATNTVANAVQSFAGGLDIGADPIAVSRIFQGQISEAAIFNYPVSSSQLNQMFAAATNALSIVSFTNAPPISFSLSNNSQLVLNWPAKYAGYYYLEIQTNSLAAGIGTNWVPVGGAAAATLNVNSWTNLISPTNGCVFYRLITNGP